MKKAYDVRVWNLDSCVLLTWENYAYGKHELKASNEEEAFKKLTEDGWEVKTFYQK